MIILAFDGTAKCASCAVLRDEVCLGEYNIDNGLTQSELLLPMAESLMKSLKLEYSDVELFATSVGPGSFTGVRIGAALVKGLAFGRNIPCAEVSTLEALAENASGLRGIIVPAMDARRGQVYTAIFRCDGENLTRLCEDMAISITELGDRLREFDEPIYITGDGYEVARKNLAAFGLKLENTPMALRNESAASVAKVALRQYREGKTVSDVELSPTYLRLPQAERERLERSKNNEK
jgi:tRNA threonylcarbamoyladenosine biosynthesis protein TsaB